MEVRQVLIPRSGIVIDIPRSRIRVHKKTIHSMGDPRFIQLLINPDTRKIGLVCCSKNAYSSIYVDPKIMASRNCFEIHGKLLVERLAELFPNWDSGKCYYIPTSIKTEANDVFFSMADYMPIKASEVDKLWLEKAAQTITKIPN